MAIEVGKVFEGTVTGLAKFGAFIKLSSGETGLCHISEIADDYVKEVADHLKEDQAVKVKVLSVDPKGKISLSIRQASENAAPKKQDDRKSRPEGSQQNRPPRREGRPNNGRPNNRPSQGRPSQGRPSQDFGGRRQQKPQDFESMLNGFMKNSDEKLRDVRKAAKSSGRKGNGHGTR
tara:strand:- start:190 stop:720 length:531 start_codon:yes stop_codon:yes gene_type:complete